VKRLLLVGGGHAHVEVMRRFGAAPEAGVEVTLASLDRFTPYSGMLPGWIAGHYGFDDCHIDLVALARACGATFRTGCVVRVDPHRGEARLDDGSTLSFDVVSIDVGSTPPVNAVTGAAAHALAVKPVGAFVAALEALEARVDAGAVRRIVAVGGGAAGVEVLLAVRHRLLARTRPEVMPLPAFAIVTDQPRLLASHHPRVQGLMAALFADRRIDVHTGFRVTEVTPLAVHASDGRVVPADVAVWATGAAAPGWVAESGLACDARGFLAVDAALRSRSHANVFAAGDVASLPQPAPKSGVYAVRAGPVLADNLRRALRGERPEAWTPQRQALALVSTGGRTAIASRGRFVLGSGIAAPLVWRWKDRIDRRFMRRYRPRGAGG
jgi:selenide,water dikinase